MIIVGDRRFRISYVGGIQTVQEGIGRLHDFWPTSFYHFGAAQYLMNQHTSPNANVLGGRHAQLHPVGTGLFQPLLYG